MFKMKMDIYHRTELRECERRRKYKRQVAENEKRGMEKGRVLEDVMERPSGETWSRNKPGGEIVLLIAK